MENLKEDLVDLAYELERLKAKLMEREEDNLEKLAQCEAAIDYFKYIIYNLNTNIQMQKGHIEKYKLLASLYENDSEDNYLLNYYLLKIDILKEDNQSQKEMCEDARKKLNICNNEKTMLLSQKEEIDALLSEVLEELDKYKETPLEEKIKEKNNVDTKTRA